jgi:hypothetical protein
MTMKKYVYDALTDINQEVEMTPEEIAEYEARQANLPKSLKEILAEQATARQVVLDRLGITAEEAQLILGGSN